MTLRVVPEGLVEMSSEVEAIAAQLAAAHAADPVSIAAAAVFSARGSQHTLTAANGVDVLDRAGLGVNLAGAGYAAGDATDAATYPAAGS